MPAAGVQPGVELAEVHAEGNGAVEGKGGVLAGEVVGGRVGALDRALLDRIHRTEGRHDLAGREDADLELAVGQGGDALGHMLAGAIDGVEALREGGGAAPAQLRGGLGEGGRGKRGGGGSGQRRPRDEATSVHRMFGSQGAHRRGRSTRH
jgi:hypothetical protein